MTVDEEQNSVYDVSVPLMPVVYVQAEVSGETVDEDDSVSAVVLAAGEAG